MLPVITRGKIKYIDNETSAEIRDNLKSKKAFSDFAIMLSKSPLQLSILGIIWIGNASGVVTLKYPELSLFENLLYMAILLILYVVAMQHWLRAWLYIGLRNNIPVIAIMSLFWFTALFVAEVCGFVFGWDATLRPDRLIACMVLSVPVISMHVYSIKDITAQSLGKDSSLVPIFTPKSLQKSTEFAVYQSADIIQSHGPYLVATTNGVEREFTRSLSSAVEKIPTASGYRVHRSYWVSYNFIDKLIYKNGNPRLLTKDGKTIPVSRAAVQQVKNVQSL